MRLTDLDRAIAMFELERQQLDTMIAKLKALRGQQAGKKMIKPTRPVMAKESA